MAYAPIALIMPQYEDYPNYWLKAYEQGTVTPLPMATDAAAGTTLAKSELDTQGFPTTAASARFIPFIDGDYDLWLFPTEAEADANDTANAIQFADNLNADPVSSIEGVIFVETIPDFATLRARSTTSVVNNEGVIVLSHDAPNFSLANPYNGGGQFAWDSTSTESDNNATVLKAADAATGRWIRLFSDVIEAAWFNVTGITDDTTAVNDAINFLTDGQTLSFASVVGDDIILRIQQSYEKSNITIDFAGKNIIWDTEPAADATEEINNGIINFVGTTAGFTENFTLTSDQTENTIEWPVLDETDYAEGDWLLIRTNLAEDSMRYLVEVIATDTNKILIDYQLGYTIPSGTQITYTKYNPVKNVVVKNVNYDDQTASDRDTGLGFIGYKYAYKCHIKNIESDNQFFKAVSQQFVNNCNVDGVKCRTPQAITGGEGYVINNSGALYCHYNDIHSYYERHLIDFTTAAFCTISNSHSSSPEPTAASASFVSHGAYEHDITIEDCNGDISFGNSAGFGDANKRIHIRGHKGQRIRMGSVWDYDVSDSYFAGAASKINADGFIFKNVHVEDLQIETGFTGNYTALQSVKESVWYGGYIDAETPSKLFTSAYESAVNFHDVTVDNWSGKNESAAGDGVAKFFDCHMKGISTYIPINVRLDTLEFIGGTWENFNVVFDQTSPTVGTQKFKAHVEITAEGSSTGEIINISRTNGTTYADIKLLIRIAGFTNTLVTSDGQLGTLSMRMRGNDIIGGIIDLADADFPSASTFMSDSNMFVGTTITNYPTGSVRRIIGDDLVI